MGDLSSAGMVLFRETEDVLTTDLLWARAESKMPEKARVKMIFFIMLNWLQNY